MQCPGHPGNYLPPHYQQRLATKAYKRVNMPNNSIIYLNFKISESGAQPKAENKRRPLGLSYLINENPPWYICLLLGFQVSRDYMRNCFERAFIGTWCSNEIKKRVR